MSPLQLLMTRLTPQTPMKTHWKKSSTMQTLREQLAGSWLMITLTTAVQNHERYSSACSEAKNVTQGYVWNILLLFLVISYPRPLISGQNTNDKMLLPKTELHVHKMLLLTPHTKVSGISSNGYHANWISDLLTWWSYKDGNVLYFSFFHELCVYAQFQTICTLPTAKYFKHPSPHKQSETFHKKLCNGWAQGFGARWPPQINSSETHCTILADMPRSHKG